MTPETIRRQCIAEGYSVPLINTLYTNAKTARFPFVLIEELGSNLSLIVAEASPQGIPSITVGMGLSFLAEAVITEGYAEKHMIFYGPPALAAKMVTGPLSGLYIGHFREEAKLFEAFTLWSPKVTIDGQITIFQHDHAAPSAFREHITSLQNYATRKYSNLFFGPDFMSMKRAI